MRRGKGKNGTSLKLLPTCSLLVLVCFLASCSSSEKVKCDLEESEAADFVTLHHDALADSIKEFSDFASGTKHFTELLFDPPRDQVVAGARDALFRLSLEGLKPLEKSEWPAKEAHIGECTNKGQSKEHCRNYIKVLVSHGEQLFACGTHAFRPKCSWREIESLGQVSQWVDGRGKCPYSPIANNSARMTEQGDYYTAGTTDFSSNDPAIYRMSGPQFKGALRTNQYNTQWLNDPDFVGSFETETFMYFLFREPAIEFTNCGKAVYSRVARVCKDDQGGVLVQKDNWTTFLKARLNCSLPGEYPFYYNEIQSMHYLEPEGTIYATFTTGENSVAASAVCSFKMSDLEEAFRGPFRKQKDPDSIWKTTSADHSHFECGAESGSRKTHLTVNSREYQFLNDAVQPVNHEPLYKVSHVSSSNHFHSFALLKHNILL